MEELINSMKRVLADSFAFYLKAQYYHWNVEGPDFKQYHDLFGEIYEKVYGSIDSTAEQIRALDSYAPGSLSRFMELKAISDENTIPPALVMISRLLTDNDIIISGLNTAFENSEANKQYHLSDYIAGLLDNHKKIGWMLRATLKPQASEAAAQTLK
jgi:starvation-inducible DNA-binding protein